MVIILLSIFLAAQTNFQLKRWHIPLILGTIAIIGVITIGLFFAFYGLNRVGRYILGFTGRGIGLTVLTYLFVVSNRCFGK